MLLIFVVPVRSSCILFHQANASNWKLKSEIFSFQSIYITKAKTTRKHEQAQRKGFATQLETTSKFFNKKKTNKPEDISFGVALNEKIEHQIFVWMLAEQYSNICHLIWISRNRKPCSGCATFFSSCFLLLAIWERNENPVVKQTLDAKIIQFTTKALWNTHTQTKCEKEKKVRLICWCRRHSITSLSEIHFKS